MATMNFGGSVAAQVARDASGGGGPVDPVRVFPDANLAAAVRTACGLPPGADIHQSDLDLVTSFTAEGAGIINLTGMEYWTTLTEIILNDNSIVDVSPLAGLTSLISLSISSNSIDDVSPLASLTSLTILQLGWNSFTDFSALASLTSLWAIDLSNLGIIDISSLAALTNLTELYIIYNNIVDISILAGLTSLTSLQLVGNSIVDVSPLAGLTSLTSLDIGDNNISDISPLVGTLGSGTWFNTGGSPLNVHAYSTDIPAFLAAGVDIYYNPEPTPTVTGIDPVSGTTAGGTPVTITGTNFLDGATVTIDGVPCTDVVFVSSISLTAVTPIGSLGAKDVVVTNDVELGTLVEGYEYT